MERNIAVLEEEISTIDLEMANGVKGYEELNGLYCRKEELNRKLEEVMELWVELEG